MQSVIVAWAWLVAHHAEIMLTLGAIVAALRAVPAPVWQRIERDWPRLANGARLARSIAPDAVKAAKVIVAIWTGRPWPASPTREETIAAITGALNEAHAAGVIRPPPLDPSKGEVLK